VRRLSARKPMVVSMSDTAASGGYFISMSGDPLLAYSNTFTGSIGVVYGKLNLSGLYEKLGFDIEILKRGRNADIDTAAGPLSDAGRKKLREGLDAVYRSFLDKVAQGRRMKIEQVEPLAQGRVWLGGQARENGLLDELGGIDKAIEMIRVKAKIAPEEKIRIVNYPRKRSLWELLFSESELSLLEMSMQWKLRKLSQRLDLPMGFGESMPMEGLLRLAPYNIRVY